MRMMIFPLSAFYCRGLFLRKSGVAMGRRLVVSDLFRTEAVEVLVLSAFGSESWYELWWFCTGPSPCRSTTPICSRPHARSKHPSARAARGGCSKQVACVRNAVDTRHNDPRDTQFRAALVGPTRPGWVLFFCWA